MEAIETFCAESILRPLLYASALELGERHPHIDVETMPRPAHSLFRPESRILWIEGRDLHADRGRWVPLEAVHTDFTLPPRPGSGYFFCSTNGLASGNDRSEALLHGLCELIERDAA